jgi:hypothetical protein
MLLRTWGMMQLLRALSVLELLGENITKVFRVLESSTTGRMPSQIVLREEFIQLEIRGQLRRMDGKDDFTRAGFCLPSTPACV